MVTQKERYYYTFRPRQEGPKWDCHKWDSLGDSGMPTATYVVDPYFGGWRGECSCPAWTTCKHIKWLQEALKGDEDSIQQIPFAKWTEKHGREEASL